MPRLRGMTWSHPRGHQPMLAATAALRERRPEIEIDWDARSLQGFEDEPISELATRYDLIAIDHPFVGEAAGILHQLDELLDPAFLAAQQAGSVGASHASYQWQERQWALAMDAAAQVSAYRTDVLARHGLTPPRTWAEVVALADQLPAPWRISFAANPTHLLATFYTLCHQNHRGRPFDDGRPGWFGINGLAREAAVPALASLRELLARSDSSATAQDPIAVLGAMANDESIAYAPFVFGYVNYAHAEFARHRLAFADAPVFGSVPGTLLGGVGIAISASTRFPDHAARFVEQICDPDFQRSGYVQSGGQPGHRSAWTDPSADELCGGFLSGTIRTLDESFVRPRLPGYPRFQQEAGVALHRGVLAGEPPERILTELDECWRSFVQPRS